MIGLIDELDDWTGLEAWLEAERVLGAVLGRQALERARPQDTVDQRLQVLGPYQAWAQALGMNLRHFRSQGYDAAAMVELRQHAEAQVREVCAANGSPLSPPATDPGQDGPAKATTSASLPPEVEAIVVRHEKSGVAGTRSRELVHALVGRGWTPRGWPELPALRLYKARRGGSRCMPTAAT